MGHVFEALAPPHEIVPPPCLFEALAPPREVSDRDDVEALALPRELRSGVLSRVLAPPHEVEQDTVDGGACSTS